MSNDLLDDFLEEVRHRGPRRKASPAPVPVQDKGPEPEPEIDPVEKNLIHASMGFAFQCGVCHKPHKTSNVENLKGLRVCLKKIVKKFGGVQRSLSAKATKKTVWIKNYGDIVNPSGLGVLWLPNPQEPETMTLTYRRRSTFNRRRPDSAAFALMYPKLNKRFTEAEKRVEQTCTREIVEDLSVKEALGAPHTIRYIVARRDAFLKRAGEEMDLIEKSQDEYDPEMVKQIEVWRTLPPEKFVVTDIERNPDKKWIRNKGPETEPITSAKLNGKYFSDEDTLTLFRTFSEYTGMVWGATNSHSGKKVLYDVGLLKGLPAISWGLLSGRRRSKTKWTSYGVMNFVSLWDGQMYLNPYAVSGEYRLSKLTLRDLISVSPDPESSVVDREDC